MRECGLGGFRFELGWFSWVSSGANGLGDGMGKVKR